MTLCKYVAGDDNSVYFTELVKLLTSGQKLYKAKRWWSISIVELLFVLQISDESTKGENKPQDGTSLDQVNAAYKNKFVAEELIRKRKLKAADDERVKKDSRKDAFMDSLASSMKELVQNVKIVAVPEAEPASAGRIRDIMMGSNSSSGSSGVTPASLFAAEIPVSRKEFDELVRQYIYFLFFICYITIFFLSSF